MRQGCRLAVVADHTDTHAVLDAVLSPQGYEVTRLRRYSDLETRHTTADPFDIVVLDADAMPHSTATAQSAEKTETPAMRHVVIGTVSISLNSETRLISKPYQMAELLQTIESLLPVRH
ncbi:hypothetical protein Spb1_09440 [Planctopirus ephydatiae]|uniref:Response regulatory domain-containing protein n=1 Tax=Planctopirus ephydatiae TaxID=2528019 RepID=A0A518GKK9_9PLAN|nr:hypothetical protein [Planctopirus ephydatiae]QDV29076.1 hypothetical protein Spb1_09440 [Planctopirus ephydatiae]